MKRDWDVIREVLIEVEGLSHSERDRMSYGLKEGHSHQNEAKNEHALMLWEAGFIDAADTGSMDGPEIIAPKLTWAGHDLLETMRSDVIWNRIKTTAEAKGIELTFDAVKALGKAALNWVIAS